MLRFCSAFALLPLAASSSISNATAQEDAQDTTCIEGYIMDYYCINRGTLLDSPTHSTLEDPQEHSLHCLLDPSVCYESGLEILGDPSKNGDMYCRAYRLHADTIELTIELGRKTGSRDTGCSRCYPEKGGQKKGFRATIKGTVDKSQGKPYVLKATSVEASSVGCGDIPAFDCSNATTDMGIDLAPVRFHGTLMLTSWGFLLPLGVIIARTQRHRDPLWFQIHRGVQSLGLFLAVIGVSIALYNFSAFDSPNPQSQMHAILGTIVMIFGVMQPVNAFFRPHKPAAGEEMSFGRKAWEWVHKGVGYIIIVVALLVVNLGTRIAGPDLGPIFQPVFYVTLTILILIGGALFWDSLQSSKAEEKPANEEIEMQG